MQIKLKKPSASNVSSPKNTILQRSGTLLEEINSPDRSLTKIELKKDNMHGQSISDLSFIKSPKHLSTLGNRSSVYHNILSGELNTISHRLELKP